MQRSFQQYAKPDLAPLVGAATSVQGAINGSVSLSGGVATFSPTNNFTGAASFTYTISDGHGGTDTATVNITIGLVG